MIFDFFRVKERVIICFQIKKPLLLSRTGKAMFSANAYYLRYLVKCNCDGSNLMQQRDTYLQGEQRQLFLSKKNQYLAIGKVPEDIFWLLVEMSAIRSQGIIKALYDYLVLGDSRKVICERYNVNNGYISTSLSRLERMNEMIKEIIPHHVKWYAGTNNYCECCARAI